MKSNKQQVSPEKAHRIHRSCQFMVVLLKMMEMEYMQDMIDSCFKSPQANQFAKRIAADINQIQHHLLNHPNYKLEVTDNDFVEEYASHLYRLNHMFLGIPIQQVEEVVDGLVELREMA